jgi:hypothetical protein
LASLNPPTKASIEVARLIKISAIAMPAAAKAVPERIR